jgi:hypothetical protein
MEEGRGKKEILKEGEKKVRDGGAKGGREGDGWRGRGREKEIEGMREGNFY